MTRSFQAIKYFFSTTKKTSKKVKKGPFFEEKIKIQKWLKNSSKTPKKISKFFPDIFKNFSKIQISEKWPKNPKFSKKWAKMSKISSFQKRHFQALKTPRTAGNAILKFFHVQKGLFRPLFGL